jgi:hypothetical protein
MSLAGRKTRVSLNNKWASEAPEVCPEAVYCILLLDIDAQHYKFAVYNGKMLMKRHELPQDVRATFCGSSYAATAAAAIVA